MHVIPEYLDACNYTQTQKTIHTLKPELVGRVVNPKVKI